MGAPLQSVHGESDEIMATINIVPFVDIVLVLLIIFMLTATSIAEGAFEVDLPHAASAGERVDSTLNIVMTQSGEIYLNGVSTQKDRIASQIVKAVAGNPKVSAIIAADKAIPYGEVVAVIDLVKTKGVRSFALNIERRQP